MLSPRDCSSLPNLWPQHGPKYCVCQVDNVEDRQSRIQAEQKEGGKGTAYTIAVSHMLKGSPAPASPRKSASRMLRGKRREGGSVLHADDDGNALELSRHSDRQATTVARKIDEDVSQENDEQDQDATDMEGSSSSMDGSENSDGSDESGEEGEGEGEEGHMRRGWAERRARLRKDGMHGRRLPPPEAEDERASAKADKREVGSLWGS